jgi:DNA-binding XRE family transcriptional regulator
MDKQEFSSIRKHLGKTQKTLANQLCVSPKAIQSFEQGWRKIPPHIERQLLLYLFSDISRNKTFKPCWDITDCPTEWRGSCAAWQHKAGHLCWFINGTYCKGKYQDSWDTKMSLCRNCSVFIQLSNFGR